MSTILKALRRLEQDKAREQSQSLEESVAAAEVRAPRRGRGRRVALLVFCILLGGGSGALLAWLSLLRDDGDRAARVAAREPVTEAPAPEESEPERRPPTISAPALTTLPPAPVASPPEGLTRRVTEESRSSTVALESAIPSLSRSHRRVRPSGPGRAFVPRDEPPVAVLRRTAPAATPSSSPGKSPPARSPTPDGGVEQPAEPAAAPEAPITASIERRLQEPEVEKAVLAERGRVPTVVRPPVPELTVRRTVWHPDSKRRAAVVQVGGQSEPLRLREGDSIESLTVLEITPSGVNFDHVGVQLYKRVGAGG